MSGQILCHNMERRKYFSIIKEKKYLKLWNSTHHCFISFTLFISILVTDYNLEMGVKYEVYGYI